MFWLAGFPEYDQQVLQVKKDTRLQVLSLLCEFVRHQPPHLHQLLQTPLFDNLLRCLPGRSVNEGYFTGHDGFGDVFAAYTELVGCPISQHFSTATVECYSGIGSGDRQWKLRWLMTATKRLGGGARKSLPSPKEKSSWVTLSFLLESPM